MPSPVWSAYQLNPQRPVVSYRVVKFPLWNRPYCNHVNLSSHNEFDRENSYLIQSSSAVIPETKSVKGEASVILSRKSLGHSGHLTFCDSCRTSGWKLAQTGHCAHSALLCHLLPPGESGTESRHCTQGCLSRIRHLHKSYQSLSQAHPCRTQLIWAFT